jgi:deleted-in-malignant-brain-tumors protein 1
MYSAKFTVCTDGDIRLVNNNNATAHEGTLEICVAGVWGTICDDFWDNTDAQVACRQLQFQAEGIVISTNIACLIAMVGPIPNLLLAL